jgi:hypothetical protein
MNYGRCKDINEDEEPKKAIIGEIEEETMATCEHR